MPQQAKPVDQIHAAVFIAIARSIFAVAFALLQCAVTSSFGRPTLRFVDGLVALLFGAFVTLVRVHVAYRIMVPTSLFAIVYFQIVDGVSIFIVSRCELRSQRDLLHQFLFCAVAFCSYLMLRTRLDALR